jgi:arylsulfatase A-like enzyme
MRTRLVALLALVTLALAPAARAAPPHTIVELMTDDEDAAWQMIRAEPTVQWLASGGVTFANAYNETPLCAPSRMSNLTGLETRHHGVYCLNPSLAHMDETIYTELARRGYAVYHGGKLLNAWVKVKGCHPIPGVARQFQMRQLQKHLGPIDWCVTGDPASPAPRMVSLPGYSADELGAWAAAQIRDTDPAVPLALFVYPVEPHDPFDPPARYRTAPCPVATYEDPATHDDATADQPAWISGKPNGPDVFSTIRQCRMLMAVDDAYAQIRQALADTGRLDDTLWVSTSDNSMNSGRENLVTSKQTIYSRRVPLYVRWDAGLGPLPRTIDAPVYVPDLPVTIMDAVGGTLGPFSTGQAGPDGLSLLPLLLGEVPDLPRHSLLMENTNAAGYPGAPKWWSVTTDAQFPGCPSWVLSDNETGKDQEFDVASDPYMTVNLLGTPAGQAAEPCLRAELSRLLTR